MVYLKPSELNNPANYNAVRIQVNDPKTRIPEDYKTNPDNDGVYNGVDIQVNRPSVETYTKPIYQYPEANGIITYDMAAAALKPRLSYQTNLINNRTYIHNNNSYDLEFEIEQPEKQAAVDEVNIGADNNANNEILDEQEAEIIPAVPEPNYTTTEAEKGEGLNFHGVNFQAKKEPERRDSAGGGNHVLSIWVRRYHLSENRRRAAYYQRQHYLSFQEQALYHGYSVRGVFCLAARSYRYLSGCLPGCLLAVFGYVHLCVPRDHGLSPNQRAVLPQKPDEPLGDH